LHERLSSKRESRAQSQPALFDKASNVSEDDTSNAGFTSPITDHQSLITANAGPTGEAVASVEPAVLEQVSV
jgi:hypothetical protein